jgi:hypothetical protein
MKPKKAGQHGHRPYRANARVPSLSGDTAASGLTGITADARVVTMDGIKPVQSLRVGDRLISRGNGAVSLRRVERQSFVTPAVYVMAGSFGHYQTDRDTLLPAAQPVCVRDWRARLIARSSSLIIPAAALVDCEFVRNIGFVPLTVYRLFCDVPQVLYADGMELGTADMPVSTALSLGSGLRVQSAENPR